MNHTLPGHGMSDRKIAISGVGLWTPEHSISNAELVESYNAFADRYNAEHAPAIESGEIEAKPERLAACIRFCLDARAGVVDMQVQPAVVAGLRRQANLDLPPFRTIEE